MTLGVASPESLWWTNWHLGPIAQLAEHRTLNPQVPGSIPGGPTIFTTGDKMRNIVMVAAALMMGCGDKEEDSASDTAVIEDTAE